MGNTFQSVFYAILKCMINHICSFKGPDGRHAWSLSPSEVEDAFFLKYPPGFLSKCAREKFKLQKKFPAFGGGAD